MGAYIEKKHFNVDSGTLASLTRSVNSETNNIVLNNAINEAEAIADNIMGYTLDLSTIVEDDLDDTLLRQLKLFRSAVCDLAIWVLAKNHPSLAMTDKIIMLKEAARQTIVSIAGNGDFIDEFQNEGSEAINLLPISVIGGFNRK